MRSFSKEEP